MFLFFSKEKRIELLDKYFEAASSLISTLMRYITERTLEDLNEFMANYNDGNEYTAPYEFYKHLALPHKMIPFRFCLVAEKQLETVRVEPTMKEAELDFCDVVDRIVDCLSDMPRLELLLFQNHGATVCSMIWIMDQTFDP